MRGIPASVWLVAAFVVALTACTKAEEPAQEAAAPAMEEQPMAPSGEMGASGAMAPSEEAGSAEEMGSSGDMESGDETGSSDPMESKEAM
jgi:hypothetical protein